MRLPKIRLVRDRPQAEEDRTLSSSSASASPVMLSSTPGARVTPANALDQVSDAYACVRALADAAASLPLHVYARRPDGSRQRVEGRTAELLRSPGLGATTPTLIGQIMTSLQLHGNAAVAKYRGRGGDRIEQLGLWSWERVEPEIRGGRVVFTLTDDRGQQTEHDERDILHIRSAVSVDGLTGLSPVAQCRETLALGSNLTRHALAFFAQDSVPRGILRTSSGPHTLPGAGGELQQLRADWESGNRGLSQSHRIAVLSGDVSFQPVSLPPEDAQFLEQRQLSSTELCRLFRVPAWLLDAPTGHSSMTYQNVSQAADFFARFSLLPWLRLIEQPISQDPDLVPPSQYVEFELDGLLRADAETRSRIYQAALDPERGWMSRGEVRKLENLDPAEDDAPPIRPQAPVATPPPAAAVSTNGGAASE